MLFRDVRLVAYYGNAGWKGSDFRRDVETPRPVTTPYDGEDAGRGELGESSPYAYVAAAGAIPGHCLDNRQAREYYHMNTTHHY